MASVARRFVVLACLFPAIVFAPDIGVAKDDTGAAAAAALLAGKPAQAPPPATSPAAINGTVPKSAVPPPSHEVTGSIALGKSGLPVPRFVSLKSSKVNVRLGPGESYDVSWTFTRQSLPVEVIQEYDTWRRVRDSDGSVGWVLQNLLSSKRTAVVSPWSAGEPKPIYATPSATSHVSAYLEAGVLADVSACHQNWCKLTGKGYSGWIGEDQLWGVYPGEEIP